MLIFSDEVQLKTIISLVELFTSGESDSPTNPCTNIAHPHNRFFPQDECATEVLAREEIRPAPKQLVRRVLSSLLHALSVRQSDVCLVRLFEGAIDFLRRYGARVFVSSVGDRMQVCIPHSHLLYPPLCGRYKLRFISFALGVGRCVRILETTAEKRTCVGL